MELTSGYSKIIIAFCLATLFFQEGFSQAGSLDSSFGWSGVVETPIFYRSVGRDVAIQADGKIVVVGHSTTNSSSYFVVARYNSNGSLDPTWDVDGVVTTSVIPWVACSATGVALQSDGKIVVVGNSDSGFALVRYQIDGSIDSSFGLAGIVISPIASADAKSVAIQSDGKIVVAGSIYDGSNFDFMISRYHSDGSVDSTFDLDGMVITAIGKGFDGARSVAIQVDGKIVVAGPSSVGACTILRYNTNGALDSTFDYDGMATTSIALGFSANSIALQSDGKIVAAGNSYNGQYAVYALARFINNGALDNTFDTDGVVTTEIGPYSTPSSVAIHADGKIVVAGSISYAGSYADFVITRYLINGTLDSTFDSDGITTTYIMGSPTNIAYAVAIQKDGNIVVAGSADHASLHPIAVVRYIGVTSKIIDSTTQNNSISIYPNPANNEIQLSNIDDLKTIKIYAVDGRVVMQINQPTSNTISIEQLARGHYLISFKTSNSVKNARFVKQ